MDGCDEVNGNCDVCEISTLTFGTISVTAIVILSILGVCIGGALLGMSSPSPSPHIQ